MKTLLLITLSLLISIVTAQEMERKTNSKIKQVTVFLNGAQVTRTSTLEISPGTTTWVLEGLSPRINEQSIQAELPESVKILSVSYRVNHIQEVSKSEQLVALETELRNLNRLIEEEQNTQEVFQEEEAMLKSNKEIGGQQQGVNIANLKTAVDYFRTRLTDIKHQQMQSKQRLATYSEKRQKIEAQLKELKNLKTQPTGEVIIKTSAKMTIRTELSVSYLVQEANWYPSYDIRAKNIQSPISLNYKANVSQHSGENWENVQLTISSANPSSSGAKPMLNTWFLGFNNAIAGRMSGLSITTNEIRGRVTAADDGSPLPGVNIVIKGTTVGTVTDVNGEFSIPLTADARALVISFIGMQTREVSLEGQNRVDVALAADVTQLQEVVVTGYGVSGADFSAGSGSYQPRIRKTIVATPVVRQTNVEYTLDEPYSIRSDGEVRAVDMIEYEVDALYQYYCIPKLDLDAFLVARLVNWDQYNLLEGEASLFFEGKYVGKSILDTRNTDDTLTLSLGRDKNVFVTREKMKDYTSHQLLGSQRKVQLAYEIKVRNKKQQAIDIRIEDQLPVPNTKEIVVDNQEDTHAEYNEETGLLTWNRKIAAGKTDKIDLRYSVKYPKQSRIILE